MPVFSSSNFFRQKDLEFPDEGRRVHLALEAYTDKELKAYDVELIAYSSDGVIFKFYVGSEAERRDTVEVLEAALGILKDVNFRYQNRKDWEINPDEPVF